MFEQSVTVVNRVVDTEGKPVPYTAYYGGDTFEIIDEMALPVGVARTVVHHSMYNLDPDTFAADYKLGCKAFNLPCDPLRQDEVTRLELLDRTLLGPDRQLGSLDRFGRKYQPVQRAYRPRRTDPIAVPNPGSSDGAFAGSFERP